MDTIKRTNQQPCSICAQIRPLDFHLYELSRACEYLGNTRQSKNLNDAREVRTDAIANWLKLASHLEKVSINSGKYVWQSSFCPDEEVGSNSKHYSQHATHLTRFLFMTNALEETYRFVEGDYDALAKSSGKNESKWVRNASLKTLLLVDTVTSPLHLLHIIRNLEINFEKYLNAHPSQLSGKQYATKGMPSYGLHLVRNLRNHVAHGIFPLAPDPEFGLSSYETNISLLKVLSYSSRLCALYIQMLLHRYNDGFISYQYTSYAGSDDEPDCVRFIQGCDVSYLNALHLVGDFSISKCFDWDSVPNGDDDD